MNTFKVNLFIHILKYSTVHSWAREQPADLSYYKLPDMARSYETAVVDYHHYKEIHEGSSAFHSSVSNSVEAIQPSKSYRHYSSWAYRKYGLMHHPNYSLTHGPQYGQKAVHVPFQILI